MSDPRRDFLGCKVMLFVGAQLVVLIRDHTPGIVWPGYLDFPGGGREDGESPEDCALREAFEEVGLDLSPYDLTLIHIRDNDGKISWFFAAHLPESARTDIRFGGEGDGWQLMPPHQYVSHPKAIPHFARILESYLASD
ncbi:NUDIX domain-containing protein [Pelagimonas varians]|uniref:NUDIX domain protein n=1 Tax=Pelagimonas varians TaxID=696760 RepID=A0A238KK45_9RHOB|nr:NUDIX hydrolase [Pelagimonas varians]PYG29458.1 8-oxo-dGTP diphosphatase [Pelagimonas varians]SMX43027.1 NUDIX domain protein [Pelagimonas varians]